MFGISTAYKSPEISDGNKLIDELEKTGVPGVELDYRLTVDAFEKIKRRLKNSSLQVLSLHNYCPHPEILPIEKASGDAFWLSAIDEQERQLAVKYSLRTIRNAYELGARAVVFHLGRIGIQRKDREWFELLKNGKFWEPEARTFVDRTLAERESAKGPYWNALLKSLEKLNREAEKLNISIGVENRYFWDDFPNFKEIGILLDQFQGGTIGYWHDVGHAQTHETFGLCDHEKFLQAYSNRLVGTHLHDCKETGYNDHFAPGTGFIDYDMIKKYLPDQAIRIIEAHPKVSAEELQQGIKFLKKKGIVN
jgi:sugar phosphate isomerase/epimerase